MRGLDAVGGIFGKAGTYHAIEHRRREGLAGANGIWIFFQNRAEYAELRFTFESAMACDHFVEHASEAEQITASVGFRSLQNFWSHILEGSDDRTFLRQRRYSRGERCEVHRRRGRSKRTDGLRGN